MLKKGLLKLFLITFVLSYILVTLYGIGANEVVVEGYNILFNAPIEQQGDRTILNINEFRKEPSLPILFADMIAITWENGVEKEVKDPHANPEKWYDYYAGRMANAKTKDGSYWVWIPRFAYRITYYTDASQSVVKGYYTDKGFVAADMETAIDESAVKTPYFKMEKEFVPNYETIKTKGFRVHEAFGKAGSQRKGFWISKYMAGADGRFAPNNTILKTEQMYQAFFNADKMTRENNPYGLDYTVQHSSIPRSTEYGALYYLIGISNPAFSPNTTTTSDISNVTSATFGNETGVFDLNNGVREWTADVAVNNFKNFEDEIKKLNMANYGVESLFMQKDGYGIDKDRVPLMGKVNLVYDRVVTSGSNKNYGEASLEFMTDYVSTDAAPYGGRSILPARNNPYNTRTSDISAPNKSIYAYEGVASNPGNIGHRAVIYAYNPDGAEIITPRTDEDAGVPGRAAQLLEANKGKYVKITFRAPYNIVELMSMGYVKYGRGQADFYIPKGTKFPFYLYVSTTTYSYREKEYRFMKWDIDPQGREFYKDTVITDVAEYADIRTNKDGDERITSDPYEKSSNKAPVKVIDENFGYMHNFGEFRVGSHIQNVVGKYIPKMPGYSTDFKDDQGRKIEVYFLPAPKTSAVFMNGLVLTTLMNNEEWLKYKTVRYYVENPDKKYIGTEIVVAGNKPAGLDNADIPEGKRLVGWSPSLDTVVTDDMEIKAILEDIQKPENAIELTVNLNGGKSPLMQNGEKVYVTRGTRLSDPVNSATLSRIRATIPNKLGYKFKGWSISENEALNSNGNLNAIWEVEKIKVTFVAPDADREYKKVITMDAGKAPEEPIETPTRNGYTFDGWTPITSIPVYSNTTYMAKWVKKDDSGKQQEHPTNGDNEKKNEENNAGNNSGNNGGNNPGNRNIPKCSRRNKDN